MYFFEKECNVTVYFECLLFFPAVKRSSSQLEQTAGLAQKNLVV